MILNGTQTLKMKLIRQKPGTAIGDSGGAVPDIRSELFRQDGDMEHNKRSEAPAPQTGLFKYPETGLSVRFSEREKASGTSRR